MGHRPWDHSLVPQTSPPNPGEGIPFRVYGLEGQMKTVDSAISDLRETTAGHGQAISAQAVTLARHDEQLGGTNSGLGEVKSDVNALAVSVAQLAEKVASVGNRVAWTLTGSTLVVLGALSAEKLLA